MSPALEGPRPKRPRRTRACTSENTSLPTGAPRRRTSYRVTLLRRRSDTQRPAWRRFGPVPPAQSVLLFCFPPRRAMFAAFIEVSGFWARFVALRGGKWIFGRFVVWDARVPAVSLYPLVAASISNLSPDWDRPGASPKSTRRFINSPSPRLWARVTGQKQSRVGHQAVIVEGDMDADGLLAW